MYDKSKYEKLHNAVLAYQSGNSEASNYIIDAYTKSGFFYMYIKIFTENRIDKYSRRMISFLKLFGKGEIEKKIYELYLVYQQSGLTRDDIYTECIITILELAKKYRSNTPSFHLYINKVFNYYLKNRIEHLLKDTYNRNAIEEIDDELIFTEIDYVYNEIADKLDYHYATRSCRIPMIKSKEIFDMNWVNGITCSDMFKSLSKLDRSIIKLYYIDKLTDERIANKLGYRSRVSINRRRSKIKTRIGNYGKDYNLLNMREEDKV